MVTRLKKFKEFLDKLTAGNCYHYKNRRDTIEVFYTVTKHNKQYIIEAYDYVRMQQVGSIEFNVHSFIKPYIQPSLMTPGSKKLLNIAGYKSYTKDYDAHCKYINDVKHDLNQTNIQPIIEIEYSVTYEGYKGKNTNTILKSLLIVVAKMCNIRYIYSYPIHKASYLVLKNLGFHPFWESDDSSPSAFNSSEYVDFYDDSSNKSNIENSNTAQFILDTEVGYHHALDILKKYCPASHT